MKNSLNTIIQGDCLSGMRELPTGSVDLVFADPPFNIGYEYDGYQDELDSLYKWKQCEVATHCKRTR